MEHERKNYKIKSMKKKLWLSKMASISIENSKMCTKIELQQTLKNIVETQESLDSN